MRILCLLSGTPASGKSTWIKENGLEQYVISPDEIRLLHQTPVLTVDGEEMISQNNDNKVWKMVNELVERRMKRGEFTIVDATHTKREDIHKYKKLITDHKYKLYVIDFSDISLEVALERNSRRGYKKVPENVIEYMNERLKHLIVPSYAKKIKPDQFWDTIRYNILDFNEYEKIHHIGDIHGCNTVLQEYLNGDLKENELYIFLGDFLDRGIENKEVIEFLISIMDRPNVIFMEGNHEMHMWKYATNNYVTSREFRETTIPQIKDVNKKKLRELYRKCNQMIIYNFDGKTVLINHGGISNYPENIVFTATDQLIRGVGKYEDCEKVAESFNRNAPEDVYQIHGHRRMSETPINIGRVFNLCDGVEHGEYLRVVTLDRNGFNCHKIKNNVFKSRDIPEVKYIPSMEEVIEQFEKNFQLINKTENPDNIISYSFNQKVFRNQIWNDITAKARGFFVHKYTHELISRGYEKFFNIGEMRETEMKFLKQRLVYPLNIYMKENGFLGLTGYNSVTDKIVFSSKSRIDGRYANMFQEIFMNIIPMYSDTIPDCEDFKNDLKEIGCTAVFEVIDPVNDPHIIKYDGAKVVLLDLIYNTVEFKKKPYEEVVEFAKKYNLPVKELCYTIDCWEDFEKWYNEINQVDWKYKDENIEGFVIEDAEGFMTKVKLRYYKFWKHMRGMKDSLKKYKDGKNPRVPTGSLTDVKSVNFYNWMDNLPKSELDNGIINLREAYEAS